MIKYLIELSKHHSIRNTLLSRKLVGKLYKSVFEVINNDEEINLLSCFVNLLIILSSVTNSKYYIPGETKAIE